ncbi:MAG: DUF262 domain-containing protein [Deltaproteobacteria bacterium]|nr:DUF262 domain-containing protein [Deltaproteobacteria bacterium]
MPEPQIFHITDLINDVKRGYIKIPQFQRDFIWSKEKAANLMDSILKGYPIGTMILWKTKENLRAIRNLGGVDLPETPSGDFIQYVLDGQQRLTSIFATLSGAKVRREYRIEDFSEIYINLDAADDEEIVLSGKDGIDEKSIIKLTSLLYGGFQYLASFSKEYLQRLEQFKTNIETYPTPSILIREVPIDIATEIFTRINEGGKPLSVFEIMVAKTFDVERDFDLAESYDALINELDRVDYETISEATVLRTASVILKKECSKKAILNLNKFDFIDIWPKAVDAIETAVDYFRNYFKIPVSRLLPYNDLIVLYAYFFYHHNERPLGDKEKYLQDLFWRISLTERYSAGTEAKIAQDIKRVDMILEGTLPDYNYSPYSKLTPEGIEQNGVFSVGRSYIKAILCILAEQQPKSFADNSIVRISNDWLKQANSRNYHHFFPKSYLKKEGVENTKINHIANITIVDAYLNKRVIGSKSPSTYMEKFTRNTMLDETMKSHLIDIETFGVMNDDYDTFFAQRIKAISDALKNKIIIQTIDQIDELLSTSDPEAINTFIAKIKKMKRKEAEAPEQPEDTVGEIVQVTEEPEEIAKVEKEAVEFVEEDNQIDLITVTRNKSSGKYFIYLEGDRDGNDTVINPIGNKIPFDADLFEDLEDIELNALLSDNLINDDQLNEYKKQKKLEHYRDDVAFQERISESILPFKVPTSWTKTPSPSAYRWASNIPELAMHGFRNWKEICDYLNLDVSGDSARRILKRWVMEKKPNWPSVPELDSDYV